MTYCNMKYIALPPFPDLGPAGRLRLATRADLNSLIDLEIHDDSQLFRYITPYTPMYSEVTVRYLEGLTRFNLMNPRTMVVVVVQKMEAQTAPEQPNAGVGTTTGTANRVVGMAVWRLPKDSARIGQFAVRGLKTHFTPTQERNLDRDVDPLRNLLCSALMHAGCEEHRFQEKLCLDKLIIRDTCRNRGYSNALLGWGKTLATQDGVDVGLLAPEDAMPFMQKHFFQTVRDFPVPRDGRHEGFTYKWCVWYREMVTKKPSRGRRSRQTKAAHSRRPGIDVPVEWDV